MNIKAVDKVKEALENALMDNYNGNMFNEREVFALAISLVEYGCIVSEDFAEDLSSGSSTVYTKEEINTPLSQIKNEGMEKIENLIQSMMGKEQVE